MVDIVVRLFVAAAAATEDVEGRDTDVRYLSPSSSRIGVVLS